MYVTLCRLKNQSLWVKPLHLCFHQFSTLEQSQSHSQIFADYLVNHLGFSRSAALSTSKKVCQSVNAKNRPDSVVNYFIHLGLTKAQIKTIVSVYPSLLSYHVEKTLQPKIQALKGIGISGKDLGNFLVKDRSFLTRGLNKQIKPSIDYLRNVLGSDEILAQVAKKYYFFFKFYKPNLMQQNVEFLKKLGFPTEYVPKLLLTNPGCLVSSKEWLEKIFHNVEKIFGISPKSKMFYYAFLASASLHKTLKTKCEVFKSFGCSDATIFEMANRCPNVLCVSEGKLRKSWHFWVDELGYEPDYLVKHPVVLCLSLDKRVKPRIEVLKNLHSTLSLLLMRHNVLSGCIILSVMLRYFLLCLFLTRSLSGRTFGSHNFIPLVNLWYTLRDLMADVGKKIICAFAQAWLVSWSFFASGCSSMIFWGRFLGGEVWTSATGTI